jgi:hypothetical protein
MKYSSALPQVFFFAEQLQMDYLYSFKLVCEVIIFIYIYTWREVTVNQLK